MSKYDIPLRVKLSDKEYDKVKDAKNVSEYVRTAINFYNTKQPREIELTKKEIIKKIIDELKEEHEKTCKELIKNEYLKNERIMAKLNKMYDKCDEELLRLARESKNCEDLPLESYDSNTTEEKILSILPTLQGMYNSEIGITYESIRRQAVNLSISAKELKDWIDDNPELMNKSDYLYREHAYESESNKRHTFEYDI